MSIYKIIRDCIGFEWDQFNIEKNRDKYKVTPFESEQAFFNKPLIIADDPKHSQNEKKFYALGKTDQERKFFIVLQSGEKR